MPILQLGLSGEGLSEQQLNDYGLNFIRTQLATIEGAASPFPYGGKQRQVQIDLNLQALQARGLSPNDVVSAISVQNLILPSGTVKVGSFEYQLATNSAPTTIQGLNDLPIKSVNGAIVYIHDVAHVRDGFPPQTNIVRVDGQRASLMTVRQERQCLHPGHHFPDQASAPDHRPVPAAAAAHYPLVRSVDFRARSH